MFFLYYIYFASNRLHQTDFKYEIKYLFLKKFIYNFFVK